MSARFFKILLGVCLVHLILLSVVWVGFSAPLSRPPATFTYEGALPSEDTASREKDLWQKSENSDQVTLDHSEAQFFNRWTKLRDPSKVFIYDHLGF